MAGMDPASPEAMAKALAGPQADPYEHMYGQAPQGNVAGSLLDTAKNWWGSGQSWADQMQQADQSNDRNAQMSLLMGLTGPASLKMKPYYPPARSYEQLKWYGPRVFNSLIGNERKYNILNEEGTPVANTQVSYDPQAKDLHIDWAGGGSIEKDPGGISNMVEKYANTLGPKELLSLIPQIKSEFPDVENLSGIRITGARAKADAPANMKIKIPKTR